MNAVPTPMVASEPEVLALYEQLLASAKNVGPYAIEEKKTSLHLVRKSAFAGVHPRKKHLITTIKAAAPLTSARVFKSEQVSKSRWHHEVKLTTPKEIDAELLTWLKQADEISG